MNRIRLRQSEPSDEEFVNNLTRTTMRPYVELTWPEHKGREHYYELNKFKLSSTKIVCDGEKPIGRLSYFY